MGHVNIVQGDPEKVSGRNLHHQLPCNVDGQSVRAIQAERMLGQTFAFWRNAEPFFKLAVTAPLALRNARGRMWTFLISIAKEAFEVFALPRPGATLCSSCLGRITPAPKSAP